MHYGGEESRRPVQLNAMVTCSGIPQLEVLNMLSLLTLPTPVVPAHPSRPRPSQWAPPTPVVPAHPSRPHPSEWAPLTPVGLRPPAVPPPPPVLAPGCGQGPAPPPPGRPARPRGHRTPPTQGTLHCKHPYPSCCAQPIPERPRAVASPLMIASSAWLQALQALWRLPPRAQDTSFGCWASF